MSDDRPKPKTATKAMIQQLFDDAADMYDQAGPSIFTRFGTRLAEHLPLEPGAAVLDVATGKGAVIIPRARKVGPEGRVTGVDLSGTILKEADRAVCAQDWPTSICAGWMPSTLEFPDEAFDAVTCAFSLFSVSGSRRCAARNVPRVPPGGCRRGIPLRQDAAAVRPGLAILLKQFMAYGRGVVMPQQVAYAPQEVEALLRQNRLPLRRHAQRDE